MSAQSRYGLSIGILGSMLVVMSACVQTGAEPPPAPSSTERGSEIVVGAFDFSESDLLAHLYGEALRSENLPVDIIGSVAPREVLLPALEQGVIDIVPEYMGSALSFASLERVTRSLPADRTHRRLAEELKPKGIVALDYARAENKNELVVTEELATRFSLDTVSDLTIADGNLIFGGPPECPDRPLCLPAIERTYGLDFAEFQPLDAGGPVTAASLRGGEVHVAVMFTTDPDIKNERFVILRDDRRLQPSENIVPVVRVEVVDTYGHLVARTLNSVTAELTPRALRRLNERVEIGGESPSEVARGWVEQLEPAEESRS